MGVTDITIRELSDEEAASVSGGRFGNPLNTPLPGSTGPTNPNEPGKDIP